MDTGSELLAAILAAPDDDTLREAYADWLDDHAGTKTCDHCRGSGKPNPKYDLDDDLNYTPGLVKGCPPCAGRGWVSDGLAERAEFIRVQCELASGPRGCRCQPYRCNNTDNTDPETGCEVYQKLWRRERELFAQSDVTRRWFGPAWPLTVAGARWDGYLNWFRRGFIESVTCPAADWLSHGDAIFAAHPVRVVRLTDFRAFDYTDRRVEGRARLCRVRGRERWTTIPLVNGQRDDYARVFAAEWPGVTFELPAVTPPRGGSLMHPA